MAGDELEFSYLDLCVHYEIDSSDELKGVVEDLREINPPDGFPNQSINVDLDEIGDTEISFSTDTPLYPQNYEQSSFLLTVNTEDDYIHSHLYSTPEYRTTLLELFEIVLEAFGPTSPTSLSIVHYSDSPVNELGVGSSPEGTRLSGVRFFENSDEYIFGEDNSGTSIRCDIEETGTLTSEDLKDTVDKHISRSEEIVQEYINGA